MEIKNGKTHVEMTLKHLEYGSVIAGTWLNPFSILKVFEAGRAAGLRLQKQLCQEAGIPYNAMFFLAWQQLDYLPEFYNRRPIASQADSYLDYVNWKWKGYSFFKPVGNSSQPFEQIIVDAETNVPLIHALATMVNIDPATRRPTPYHPYLKEFYSKHNYSPPIKIVDTMPFACRERYEMPKNVRYFSKTSDVTVLQIDRNGHVNQAYYMNLCLECLGNAFANLIFEGFSSMFDYDLRRISFLYLKECHSGDIIHTRVWQDDQNSLVFKFHILKQEALLCQAEIEFFPPKHNSKSRL